MTNKTVSMIAIEQLSYDGITIAAGARFQVEEPDVEILLEAGLVRKPDNRRVRPVGADPAGYDRRDMQAKS